MRIRTGLVLALLLVLPAAGCARGGDKDDGVASAGGAKPSASASGQGDRDPAKDQERMLEFAKCMREHGVPMEDPEFEGNGVSIMIPEGTDKTKIDAAQAACKQYMPNGGEPMKADPQMQEQMRKFAQCMRENGVPNFPDPGEDGGLMIEGDKLGVDPKSETFKNAEKACEQFQPKGKDGEGSSTQERGGAGGGSNA
jgi:hypothetical protein